MSYTQEIKIRADNMRSSGYSYSIIREKLGIPKSTLSTWFNRTHAHIFNKEKQIEHLKKARISAGIAIQKRIKERQELVEQKVKNDIKHYPTSDMGFMKTILASLYWAEGSKHDKVSGLIFTNTDPSLIELYVTLLRKCYSINEDKFRIRLHVHYYHDKNKCLQFWSKIVGIRRENFSKPYIKSRSKTKKFRRNFMGICFVYYGDSGIRRELLEIGKQLKTYYCK